MGQILRDDESLVWPAGAIPAAGVSIVLTNTVEKPPAKPKGEVKSVEANNSAFQGYAAEVFGTVVGLELLAVATAAAIAARMRLSRNG